MKYLVCNIFILLYATAYGQAITDCKVEIFLFKENISKNDSATFSPTIQFLEDSAFITDKEIQSYNFKIIKIKRSTNRKQLRQIHTIKTSFVLTGKLDNITLQKNGGRKFAFVIDNKIIYWGYLSSIYSSIVPDSKVNAQIDGYELNLNYYSSNPNISDPRQNETIISCFKKTGRYIYRSKRNGN